MSTLVITTNVLKLFTLSPTGHLSLWIKSFYRSFFTSEKLSGKVASKISNNNYSYLNTIYCWNFLLNEWPHADTTTNWLEPQAEHSKIFSSKGLEKLQHLDIKGSKPKRAQFISWYLKRGHSKSHSPTWLKKLDLSQKWP